LFGINFAGKLSARIEKKSPRKVTESVSQCSDGEKSPEKVTEKAAQCPNRVKITEKGNREPSLNEIKILLTVAFLLTVYLIAVQLPQSFQYDRCNASHKFFHELLMDNSLELLLKWHVLHLALSLYLGK